MKQQMDISLNNCILAIFVTRDQIDNVAGSVPIFIVDTKEELEQKSMLMARITMSMVHELDQGLRIIVKH